MALDTRNSCHVLFHIPFWLLGKKSTDVSKNLRVKPQSRWEINAESLGCVLPYFLQRLGLEVFFFP